MPQQPLDARSLRALLVESGLTVLGTAPPAGLPGVMAAWRPVINIGAVPVARIGLTVPDPAGETDRRWHDHVSDLGLVPGGTFLIGVAGAGAVERGWTPVRYAPGARVTAALERAGLPPEFVSMSVDGRWVCGVTPEEFDIWIVRAEPAT